MCAPQYSKTIQKGKCNGIKTYSLGQHVDIATDEEVSLHNLFICFLVILSSIVLIPSTFTLTLKNQSRWLQYRNFCCRKILISAGKRRQEALSHQARKGS